MHTDSRYGPLPLADAIIHWSDPALVSAVRAAETLYEPGVLDEFGRDRLDALLPGKPPRSRVNLRHSDSRGQMLLPYDQAWYDLIIGFRGMVERGAVALAGLPSEPQPSNEREFIPASFAPKLKFNVSGGTVSADDRRFIAVVASRVEAAGEDLVPVLLPLSRALTSWSEPSLVEAVRRAERRHIAFHLKEFYCQSDTSGVIPADVSRAGAWR